MSTAEGGARAWDGLAVAICSDRVLIGPEAAALVLSLVNGAERIARRDGIRLSPQLAYLREVLRVVAVNGHADVHNEGIPAPWNEDEIDTQEAAEMLGVSSRQARRIVASGSLGATRRRGRMWLVSKAEVAAYVTQREDRTA